MHLLNEIPYYTTKVSIEQSQLDIIKLMKKYNTSGYQWTSFKDKSALKFILNNKPFLLEVPNLQAIKKTKYREEIINVKKEICFRFFYWKLKSVLEISAFEESEQLLLSYQLIKTTNGYKTIGESIYESPNYLLPEGEETFK